MFIAPLFWFCTVNLAAIAAAALIPSPESETIQRQCAHDRGGVCKAVSTALPVDDADNVGLWSSARWMLVNSGTASIVRMCQSMGYP
jgi:hypothetical protein